MFAIILYLRLNGRQPIFYLSTRPGLARLSILTHVMELDPELPPMCRK